jgi:peptide-methionine (R)-S-oxide reductase
MAEERYPVMRSEADWKRLLTPAQFQILRKAGTEPAGTSPLNNEHRQGRFLCAGCNTALYSSKTKFESGTGWPSFYEPISPRVVQTKTDRSYFMVRTEVLCATCGGHLGHVFPDGPRPTGLRYCMNGLALKFQPGQA